MATGHAERKVRPMNGKTPTKGEREWLNAITGLGCIVCRPLRTPEQRERQSVIEQAFSKLSEFHDADQVLGELYDAGMLHKQED